MKQTNLEWLNSLIISEQRVREFDLQYAEYRNLPSGDKYNAISKILVWLSLEHVEPIVLTAEERKAVKLLIDCGCTVISKSNSDDFPLNVYVGETAAHAWNIKAIPNARILRESTWITPEYIDLRPLL